MKILIKMLVMFSLLCGLAGCEAAPHQNLTATTPQNPALSRLLMTNLDGTRVQDWQVYAVAIYRPTGERTEDNTETSTSYGNCNSGRFNVNVLPCTRTFDKALEKYLPKEQLSYNPQGQLAVDFSFDAVAGKSNYFLDEVYLNIKRCKDCTETFFSVNMSCYAEDITPENLQQKMIVHLNHGSAVSKHAKNCGLKKESHVANFTRDTVMRVIKGHFSEQDHIPSFELLNTYFAIPTKQGGWIANKSHVGEFMADYCPLPMNTTGYNRTDLTPELDQKVGWPYLPKVEMLVYRMESGELCEIVIDGTAQLGDITPYVRYTYLFKQGQLALLKTEEADDTERWLRYENGEPLEYLRKHDPDSVAGGEDVVYWHRDAAKEWPERMDFTPDWNEFTQAIAHAQALTEQYVKPLPAVNAKN